MSQLSIYQERKIPDKAGLLKVKWSYSRRSILNQCLRRYYYHYCASAQVRNNHEHFDKLKEISTAEVVLGNIIHLIIASAFRNAHKGDEWDFDRIVSFGKKLVNDAIEQSKGYRSLYNSKLKFPVLEIVFDEQDDEDFKEWAYDHIEVVIENLITNSAFLKIYEAGKIDSSMVERSTTFKLNQSITVYGQLDLAYYDQHKINIIDWKTGDSVFEDSSLQLLVYGLWATEEEGIDIKEINISKVYLKDNWQENFDFDTLELDRTRARIIQDSLKMSELTDFADADIIEAFDKCESKDVCSNCSFKRICYG